MLKGLIALAGIVETIKFWNDKVPSSLIVGASLNIVSRSTQHQVDIEVTKLLVPVRHQVVAQVAILVSIDTVHTILPYLLDGTSRSNLVSALGCVGVNTHAIANPPPVKQIPLHVHVTSETLRVIGHLVFVNNPIGVVSFVPGIKIGNQVVAQAVLIQIMTHVIKRRPVVGGIERTSTR